MSKTLKDAPLTTKAARARLPAGEHFRAVDPGTHLGYRKGSKCGRWFIRRRSGRNYRWDTLATADDVMEANGVTVLDYAQALTAVRVKAQSWAAEDKIKAEGPPQTVTDVVKAYIEIREARERALDLMNRKRDARSRLTKHVIKSKLGPVALRDLTVPDLRSWRENLPSDFAPATVRRLTNDLKAALNDAIRANYGKLPAGLMEVVKIGLSMPTGYATDIRHEIITEAQRDRLIAAAADVDCKRGFAGDLLRLISVMAATGARYSQVARIRVGDVQAENRRMIIPPSRKGRGKVRPPVPFPIDPSLLQMLRPVLEGRRPDEYLLTRWYKRLEPGFVWVEDRRAPWAASGLGRDWDEIVRIAECPGVDAYGFRHAAIIRALRMRTPIRVVAALFNTSVLAIERHYSAYILDQVNEMVAPIALEMPPAIRTLTSASGQ